MLLQAFQKKASSIRATLQSRLKSTLTNNLKGTSPSKKLLLLAPLSTLSHQQETFQTLNSSHLALGLLLLGSSAAAYNSQTEISENCGIVGIVGTLPKDKNTQPLIAREFLIEGLTVLKNRGYDSAGVCTVGPTVDDTGYLTNSKLLVTKFASKGDNADGVELVKAASHQNEKEKVPKGSYHVTGIAHTRWATHGGKTDSNSHPHLDSSGTIAVVHNGTINNANELREELTTEGHSFSSETDSEVVAKLIGSIKEKNPKFTLKDSVERALQRCDGSWGLCVLSQDSPDELVVACNGSPLVIGLGRNVTFVASETSAFNRYTKEFISMKDGEIGIIHPDGRTLDLTRVQTAADQKIVTSPAPFEHWTLKECYEQPEAIARALGFGGRFSNGNVKLGGPDSNVEKLTAIKNLKLSACGTSLNASLYGAKLMKSIGSFDSVITIDAGECTVKDFNLQSSNDGINRINNAGLIVVSQSGETKDLMRVVNLAMEKGISVLSVVNAVGSLIARTTKLGVYLNAGRENAVASTKAFTTQVTVLALLALWFRQQKELLGLLPQRSKVGMNELEDSLMRLPISFGIALQTRGQCKEIAKLLNTKEHLFVLGKGYGEPVAYEGALKIKETSYLHAEGFSGGALKHGPFALIENGETGKFGATPIILIILDDEHKHAMRTAAEEVKARGAHVIIITDNEALAKGLTDDENIIMIPNNGPLTALIGVLPLQLIAYELAILRGINPDTPRNLAKAVTVD